MEKVRPGVLVLAVSGALATMPPPPPPLQPPPLRPPADCSRFTSTHGSLECVQQYVHSVPEVCIAQSESVCRNAAAQLAQSEGDECVTTTEEGESGGFMWGMWVSIFGDIIISIGLALQKVSAPHNARRIAPTPLAARLR